MVLKLYINMANWRSSQEKMFMCDPEDFTHAPGSLTGAEQHLPMSENCSCTNPEGEKKYWNTAQNYWNYMELIWAFKSILMLTEGIFISFYSRVIIRQHLKSSTSLSQTPYTPNKTYDTITYSLDKHVLGASCVLCVVTWAWDTQVSQKAWAAFCGTMSHSYNFSPLIKIYLTNPTSNFDFHPICLANL